MKPKDQNYSKSRRLKNQIKAVVTIVSGKTTGAIEDIEYESQIYEAMK